MDSILTAFYTNFIIALLILVLGFFVLRRNSKDVQNKLFSLLTFFNAYWIFTSAMVDISQGNVTTSMLYANLAIVGPMFFVPTFFIFSHEFVGKRYAMKTWQIILLYAPAFLALPVILTKYNVRSISIEDWGVDFVPGSLYYVLLVYTVIVLSLSFYELYKKYKTYSEKTIRAQIRFFIYGFFLMAFSATVANIVLPLLGYGRAAVIGPSSTVFFVIFTAYAIVKHHLFEVKVIAAEFFSAGVALFMFIQIFGASSPFDFALRISLFVITAFFAALLVRSVIKEIKQRKEVQRLAKQLQTSNKRLRRLDTMKTTMVSIASHQLRGPLGGMRGYFTMFRDGDLGPLTDKQKEIVKMNLNTLSRLLNAVETFLDITKLEAGKMVLRKEVLPLDDAVKDVAHEFEIMLERKGLELKTDIEDHVWVEFDPEKIKHVIFNLIDNAMKYTESGWIKVGLKKEGGQAIMCITDSGKGIPADDLPKLFGKFQRGELAVDRGGSGLGLYVVKMLTEMQGGIVEVSSPGVDKGSTFTVKLPLSKDHH